MTFNISRFWIASLGAGRTRGRIGMAACPGWAPRSPLESSAVRDFEQDMSAVVRWAPDLVLTLLESDEFWEYRVGMLPQTLATRGIPYQHFPMAPDGLPDESFEQRWATKISTMLAGHIASTSMSSLPMMQGILSS